MPALLEGAVADSAVLAAAGGYAIVMRLLAGIEEGRVRGKHLGIVNHTGDLSDCRRVAFDLARVGSLRYRVIYRQNPDRTAGAPTFQVVALGLRLNMEVYTVAVRRLGREN